MKIKIKKKNKFNNQKIWNKKKLIMGSISMEIMEKNMAMKIKKMKKERVWNDTKEIWKIKKEK